VHGPPARVDLKVMDLRVCAVDRIPRIKHLRKKPDKVRKRDVILKLNPRTDDIETVAGAEIRVTQVQNSFPIGSCITKAGIQRARRTWTSSPGTSTGWCWRTSSSGTTRRPPRGR
jgi:hypothetical protein